MIRIVACILLLALTASCVKRQPAYSTSYTQTRNIGFLVDSVPNNATIKLDNNVVGQTPFTVQINYLYKVRGYSKDETTFHTLSVSKEGYEKFTTNFSIRGKEYQKIPSPIRMRKLLDEAVSVTGAGGLLRRLTVGGPSESVLDLSPNKKWLLIQAQDDNNHRVLQKISLKNNNKIILSSRTSDNIEAKWSADMKSFVFITNRMGGYTLAKSLGVKGETAVRFITEPSFGNIRNPDLNRNGEIVFSVSRGNNADVISIVENDGTNIRMFGPGRQPAWSPSDNSIVFVRQVGKYSHLFSMSPSEGANLMQLSSSRANDRYPNWSPDGKHIAFISDRVDGNRHIFIMDKNGGKVTQVTEGSYNVSSLAWGNDGFIYFSANAGGNRDIWRLKSNL